jgi:hypothetical protein
MMASSSNNNNNKNNNQHGDHSKDEMDAMIANELIALSIKDRELCYHDVHGVSDAIDETPEFVQDKLKELEEELAKISRNKSAYLLAETLDKDYVRCRSFRLKFLRAESFDAKLAANHLVIFFEEKLKLFGPELLAKDIKISDLDQDDIKWLESGIAQLPARDRAGRCVFSFIVPNAPKDVHGEKATRSKVSSLKQQTNAACLLVRHKQYEIEGAECRVRTFTLLLIVMNILVSGFLLRTNDSHQRRGDPKEGNGWMFGKYGKSPAFPLRLSSTIRQSG